jgi:hypothetical protein
MKVNFRQSLGAKAASFTTGAVLVCAVFISICASVWILTRKVVWTIVCLFIFLFLLADMWEGIKTWLKGFREKQS